MGNSRTARVFALLACAVLAYDSAGVTSASQQSSTTTSAVSAAFIAAPATLSSKTVKNPYRQIFPLRELKARPQASVEIPLPKAPNNPEINCGLKIFHPDPNADPKIKVETPKPSEAFAIRRLQPKVCQD